MADTERQVELIKCILKNLEEESRDLHDALSTNVEQVTSAGRMWVESQGMNSSSFRDIKNQLNNSVDLIMDIRERIQYAQRLNETDESSSPSSSSKLAGLGSSLADHLLLKLQDRLETMEKKMTRVVEMEEMDGLKKELKKNLEKVELTEKKMKKLEGDLTEKKKEEETKSAKLKKLEEKMTNKEKEYELIVKRVMKLEEDMREVQTAKVKEKIEKGIKSLNEKEKADQTKEKLLEDRLVKMEAERKKGTQHIGAIQSELKTCVSSVDEIKERRQLQVAVRARISLGGHKLQHGRVLNDFTEVIILIPNKKDLYDPYSGKFTAPVDGVYMTSLVHTQNGNCGVGLRLYQSGPGGDSEKEVCGTWTLVRMTSCTGVGVVWMSAGDKLYVKMSTTDGDGSGDMSICDPSSFSCYLIN